MPTNSNRPPRPTLRYKEFIESKLAGPFAERGVPSVMNNLNNYITLDILNDYISSTTSHNSQSVGDVSGADSIRGKICEEIIIYALLRQLEQDGRNDIFIETKSETIADYFSVKSAHNVNLKKKFDVDVLLRNENNTKFYALSVKGTTRERIGQSQLVLFMLDKKLMDLKYNAQDTLFTSKIWTQGVKVKYGMVVYDYAKSKDYAKRYDKHGNPRTNLTREFDVEMFFQDKTLGGGFTILNNLENFDNTIKFSELYGKIISFFDTNNSSQR